MTLENIIAPVVAFNLDNSPKDLVLTDGSNYASIGIDPNNVLGIIKATYLSVPNQIFYENTNFGTPDVDLSSSPDSGGIDLPLDGDGNVLPGEYQFDYTIRVADWAHPIIDVDVNDDFISITGNYETEVLAAGGFDITGSTGNDGSYTVLSAQYQSSGNRTLVFVNEDITDATIDGDIELDNVDQLVTFTREFCHVDPDVCIEHQLNCEKSELISKDVTVLGGSEVTSVVRTHTLNYPQSLNPPIAPITGPTVQITATPIYTKTWTTEISLDVEYTYADGLIVNTTLTGAKDIEVKCDNSLCNTYPCIVNLTNRYEKEKQTNPAEAAETKLILDEVTIYYMLYSIARLCGNNDDVSKWGSKIKELVNDDDCGCGCDDGCSDCGCDDGSSDLPVQVVPVNA